MRSASYGKEDTELGVIMCALKGAIPEKMKNRISNYPTDRRYAG